MARVLVGIDIAAPPAEVWRVVEPVESHVEWMQDAVAIRFATDQTRGVGTRTVVDTKVGPFRLTDEMTITSWIPEREMGVEHTGAVTGTGRFTLEPLGAGGTRFTWDEELEFPWWLGGPLGARVGGGLVLRAVWRRNLRALKEIVERRL
jgi:carbon monoxide dehydrogenase subunit G